MEFFQKLGDQTSALWAHFQHAETGELTLLGALLLAGLALATALRCVRAIQPALGDKALGSVVAVGGTIAAVFGTVGLYFLYVALGTA